MTRWHKRELIQLAIWLMAAAFAASGLFLHMAVRYFTRKREALVDERDEQIEKISCR